MKFIKISTIAVAAFALAVPMSALMLHDNAAATKSAKVTICHATNSHTNPYVKETVNTSSVTELNNPHAQNGHGDHLGAVWYKGIADHSWGDIIPPFVSPEGHSFAGRNWNTAGKAIYNNGCKSTTSTTPTTPTKPTNPTTPTTPTTPDDKGEVKGDTTDTPSENPKAGDDLSPVTELPYTGMDGLVWAGIAGLGGITYIVTFLIRKLFTN